MEEIKLGGNTEITAQFAKVLLIPIDPEASGLQKAG